MRPSARIVKEGVALVRWALALPERLRRAPPKQVALAGLYYGLYLLPAATVLAFDALYLLWLLSGLFLATAVRWLWAYEGVAGRLAALTLNAATAFANLLLAISLQVQGTAFNLQFFFHAELETLQVAMRVAAPLFAGSWAYLFLVSVWPCLLTASRRRPRPRAVAIATAAGLCLNAPIPSFGWHSLNQAIDEANAILVPKPANPPVAPVRLERPKNLVLIFAEALEATYGRADIFGENLTPALTALAGYGLQFTNMRQVSHTDWTTGGLVAAQCGLPMGAGAKEQSLTDRFDARMRGVLCLGDLLAAHGYRTVFMQGATLSFAGVGSFHVSHGFSELHGLESLASKLGNAAYRSHWARSNWGLHDDSLFALAREKLADMQAASPFALALLTLDTHGPFGFPSASCGPPGDGESLVFAVRCTDRLIADFIQSVRTQFPNTLIALFSDHLVGHVWNDPEVMDRLKLHAAQRRLRFAVWGPGVEPGEIDRPGTHFDLMPTLMDLLGMAPWIRHNMGASLLRFDSPWFSHENPEDLRVVHSLPGLAVRPGDELAFEADGPMLELDGRKILATGKGLSLRDEVFALELDAAGGVAAIRRFASEGQVAAAEEFERWAGGKTVVGVSTDPAFNRDALRQDAADAAFFAGAFGTRNFIAGPLHSRSTVALPSHRSRPPVDG